MLQDLKAFLTGNTQRAIRLIKSAENSYMVKCLWTIIICGGVYGMSIGLWRSPLQALYVFIKFPLLILLTVMGNALINWMFSILVGFHITLKQSVLIILSSFMVACIILFSLVPVTLFMLYHVPAAGSSERVMAVSMITVLNVCIIALAGILSNLKTVQLLKQMSPGNISGKVLLIWLTANLFLGSQISWNLRPFIGHPGLKVEFIRKGAFTGTFYEDVYKKLNTIISKGEHNGRKSN